jgi:hypothetical protein
MDADAIGRALEDARRLAEDGRTGEARDAYLRIVAAAPDHPRALTDFGTFLVRNGFRAAARTLYERAVSLAPQSALAHANLAGALYADTDYEGARRAYEAALALDPAMTAAHQGLSYALTRLDREDEALVHRRLGFAGRAVSTAPYRGAGRPRDVLLLVAARGGTIYTESFLDADTFRVTTLVADAYAGEPLPATDVIFNAIADADRAGAELRAMEALLRDARAPLLNPPARVLATAREAGAQRLAALPGVVAPRVARAAAADLIADPGGTAARLGFAFPLLVRAPGFHTGRHFERAENAGELATAVATFPASETLLIEYIDIRNSDGAARKYRVMAIGGALYPLHAAVAGDWKVHYATAGMERDAAKRAEDERFLADPRAAIGARAYAALERIRDEIRLDYMGIDFALTRDGRVVAFEANATMIVLPPGPEPIWDYRRAPVERVLGAAKKLLLRHNETAPPTA